ncbi:MAG: hypothetical protein ACERKD_08865 [Prolixibacteraceae bacterium]
MDYSQISWNNDTFNKAIKFLLAKTFDLREGEYKRAFLMQLNIFLIITTLLVIKPTVNGLFISQFGVESMPLAFVIVAICATGFSVFYSKKLIAIPLHLLIRRTLIVSVATLISFGILLSFNILTNWVIYLLYIWVAIFAVLSASQFWILANMVFNSREAKRLFGFIGAGAIAGGIFGGYLTSLLASSIGTENLLFVSAFILFFCIPITQTIWRENISGKQSVFTSRSLPKGINDNPFQLIRKSKHLTYLAGIVGVSVIVAKLVDYQFNAIASHKITNPDELTAFFGFWFSNFNVLSLVIQLFLTRRVVGVFGVGTSLFVLPAAIFSGAVLILFAPSLFAAIFIKMADGSLKQSINKSSVELLALPIPLEIKNKTKTFIDVFVDSVATGIGGLILILVVNAFQLSTNLISLIILLVLSAWFYFAMQVRKEYIHSFQLKIKSTEKSTSNKTIKNSDSILNGLITVLQKGNDKQILWVLQKSLENPNDKLFTPIVKLLLHHNGSIRAEALRNLYFYRNSSLIPQISGMINDPDQEVKIRAFEYLMAHDPENRISIMNKYLNDDNYKISGAALLSLASEVRDNPELKKQYELRRIIALKINQLAAEPHPEIAHEITKILLIAIGKGNIVSYFSFIENGLQNSHPDLVKTAIVAAGYSMSPEFIDRLIQFIPDKHHFNDTSAALARYGVEILTILQTQVELPNNLSISRKIPSIVANIDSQKSVEFLFKLMDSEDFQIRQEALVSLNTLKIKFPFLHFDRKLVIDTIFEEVNTIQDTLSILYLQSKLEQVVPTAVNEEIIEARKSLIILLERRLDGALNRIFSLLELKYPPEEISSAHKSFQSTKLDIRISSIEYLENILDSRLKKVLIPLFETTTLETISKETLKNLNIHIPDEIECYQMLLNGNDIKIKLAVLYLITQIRGIQYLQLVQNYVNNPNQKVSDFAKKAVQALTA